MGRAVSNEIDHHAARGFEGETGHPVTSSEVDHARQSEVTHTPTRARINILIFRSITATDEGIVGLSWSVLATDNPLLPSVCY